MAGFFDWVGNVAKTHSKILTGVARHEGLTGEEALDAVQEALVTFMHLPQARSLVDEVDDTAKLLTIITRNVARNMRRKHHRSRPHTDAAADQTLADVTPSADELVAQAEEHIRLLGCLNELDQLQRDVLVLRMLEEVAAADVAASLGLTPTNVGVLLHRAKKKISVCLLG